MLNSGGVLGLAVVQMDDQLQFLKRIDFEDIRAGRYRGEGVMAILINDDGQILLNLRDDIPTISYPGYWAILGGGIELGEAAEDAIHRELIEEIGIDVRDLRVYGAIIDRFGYGNLLIIFNGRIDKRIEDLTLNEGQALKYFDQAELPGLKISPPLKEVVLHYFFGPASDTSSLD